MSLQGKDDLMPLTQKCTSNANSKLVPLRANASVKANTYIIALFLHVFPFRHLLKLVL